MYERLVVIDLETTGLDEYRDDIIEVGAVRIENGRITEQFEQLVNPGRPIPLPITKLTGIRDEDVRGQPKWMQVLPRLSSFIGHHTLVAHYAPFERKFLAAKTHGTLRNEILDTLELARILLPTEDHHDLESLIRKFNLAEQEQHRAADDARMTALLWLVLLEELDKLDHQLLEWMVQLVGASEWNLAPLFVAAEAKKAKKALETRIVPVFDDFSAIIDVKPEADGAEVEPGPIDSKSVASFFQVDGPLAQSLDGYESRPEQVQMATAICDAFNERAHLMIEAGTGTGKSIAYLVPAIHLAKKQRAKVVVSTYTKNLQAQLFFKDIPLLERTLATDFKAALIKGRANYLCVRKFHYLLNEAERELDDNDRVAILAVIVWAAMTKVGDIAENAGFLSAQRGDLWSKLYSTGEECLWRSCNYRRHCFLTKARALAMAADLIVANHAVVFSELGIESPVLPPYRHLVFDEAHNIEDIATSHLGYEMTRWRVVRILNRLYREDRRGAGKGILTNILFQMRRGREAELGDSEKQTERLLLDSFSAVSEIQGNVDTFLGTLAAVFASERPREDKVRYHHSTMRPDVWGPVDVEKRVLVSNIGGLCRGLDRVCQNLARMDEDGKDFPYRSDYLRELRGQLQALQELVTDLDLLLEAGEDEDDFVFWVQRQGGDLPRYSLHGAPIDVGERLNHLLYEEMDSIVFSSATLCINNKFHFLKSRLGLNLTEGDRVRELNVGSSFDFSRQSMLCVPSFIPEPQYENEKFFEEIPSLLVDLFRTTRGRALALFTSYSMLNRMHPELKDDLEADRITVLAQGIDGGREHLTRVFQRDVESVLLGTQSFWEGVDVPGEALSCLVIVKLPFAVFTEPIVQARCEKIQAQGKDPFLFYTVPSAIIKFKQGFGRLIRHKTDRGVVVILDKRVLTRRYGSRFLSALPAPQRVFGNREQMLNAIAKFLTR